MAFGSSVLTHKKEQQIKIAGEFKPTVDCLCAIRRGFVAVYIQVLLEANGLAAGKDHQFKGRYDAEKNAVIISLEKDEQSALSPQKCTT